MGPYRASRAQALEGSSAPPLDWARWPSAILLSLGAAPVLVTVAQLFVDRGCAGTPHPPHVLEALLLAVLLSAATAVGLAIQGALARVVRRRVRDRSAWARLFAGAVALAPVACVVAVDLALSAVFYVEFLFHVCLDRGLFSFGC